MTTRFKKVDDFDMVLRALENSDRKGQESILSDIFRLDPMKANLLRESLLTPEKILAMDIRFISDILPHIPEYLLPLILAQRSPIYIGKVMTLLPDQQRRFLDAQMKSLDPSSTQIRTAEIKFVQIVRDLEKKKVIFLDSSGRRVQARSG